MIFKGFGDFSALIVLELPLLALAGSICLLHKTSGSHSARRFYDIKYAKRDDEWI